jgi:hypothetical protein
MSPSGVTFFDGAVSASTARRQLCPVFAKREGLPLERWNLLHKRLEPAAKKLTLPGVAPDLLRHSHAKMQSPLGHFTPEITPEIYLHSIDLLRPS